jgi:WD40 repeat protein
LHEATPLSWSAISPDGKRLAAASTVDHKVRLWDLATGKSTLDSKEFFGDFGSLTFSPDGKVLAWATTAIIPKQSFTSIMVWDLAGRRKFERLLAGQSGCTVALSPDGKLLALAMPDGWLKLHGTASGKELWSVEAEKGFYTAAFAPDGTRLATGAGDGTVRFYDLRGEAWGQLRLGKHPVVALAYSADGKHLAAGDTRGALVVWRVRGRREVLRRKGPSGVASIAFAPDGTKLATGMWDTTVLVWDLPQTKGPYP